MMDFFLILLVLCSRHVAAAETEETSDKLLKLQEQCMRQNYILEQVVAARTDVGTLNELVKNRHQDQITQLQSQIADMDTTNADLQSNIADLNSTNADLQSNIADLSSTNADLLSRNEALLSQISHLKTQNAELAESLDTYRLLPRLRVGINVVIFSYLHEI